MVGLSSAQGLTINLWTNHWYYHSQHTCLCIPAATTVYIPMLQPTSGEKCFNQISGIHIVWVKKEKQWKSSPRRTASRYLLRTLTTFLTIFVSHPPWLWQGTVQTRDGLAFGKQIYVSADRGSLRYLAPLLFSCPGSSIPNLVSGSVSNSHFKILTQIVTFDTWDPSDIWWEWRKRRPRENLILWCQGSFVLLECFAFS